MLKEKKKVLSKTLAFVLTLVMVIGLMPVTSFAEETGEVTEFTEEKQTEAEAPQTEVIEEGPTLTENPESIGGGRI